MSLNLLGCKKKSHSPNGFFLLRMGKAGKKSVIQFIQRANVLLI